MLNPKTVTTDTNTAGQACLTPTMTNLVLPSSLLAYSLPGMGFLVELSQQLIDRTGSMQMVALKQ